MKKIILILTVIFLVAQTTYAVEPETVQNNFQQNFNMEPDDNFVKAITFEDLTKSVSNFEKNTSVMDDFKNASSRYAQTNVVAAYKDFSHIINSMENKNDFLYVTIMFRLSTFGFFTLGQNALINVEDNDLWFSSIDFLKKMYNPSVTLTYDEEIYLSQLHTATLYNNSAKETINTLEDNEKLLKKSDYANYVLAVAYFENKNYSKSMNAINKAISKAPDCINYMHFKEKIYSEMGNYKNALKIIEDIEETSSNKNYTKEILASDKYYILMKINKKDKAKYYSAKLLFLKGDSQKALKEAQSAISINKKNLDAYALIGDYYIESKEPEKALTYYQKALDLKQKYAPAIKGMGNYYFMKKDYQKSLEYYQKAYKYSPQDEQLLLCLANNYILLNDTEKANTFLSKVLKINSTSDGAYYLMSKVIPEMKEQYLRKSLSINALNTHAWLDLAELKISQKNYKKAEEYLFPLLVLDPQNQKYLNLKKLIIMKNGGNISLNETTPAEDIYQPFFNKNIL